MNFYIPPEQPTSSYIRLDSGDYELIVRQQPREALIAQPGKEKNRKPIDPPPIVQLKVPEVKDPIRQFLQSPYLFMMCHLEPSDTSISSQDAKEALIGSISSSLHRLKDINNEDGGFFVFGDISVKIPGTHRLRFTLMELQKDEGRVVSLRSILSEPFNVVPQKHWRGLEESTYLSRAFSDQGVRLRLRKENRTMSQKRNYQSFQDPQPGPSSVTGEQTGSVYGASPVSSQYGFGEGLPKRQRSDDYSQQGIFVPERAVPGYAPREFSSSLSNVPGYPVQSAAPRQSPQTAYGFQNPAASSTIPSYYPQGQSTPSVRTMESSTRQPQVTTPGGSFTYQTSDHGDFYPRRPVETYTSMQQTPAGLTHTVGGPSETYQGPEQTMFTPSGQPGGAGAATLYSHANMPSPMGPTTGGSSSRVQTPSSARGSTLNPSAPSFNIHPQPVPSQHLPSQGYGNIVDPRQYSYGHTASQQYAQNQPQTFQQSPPTTMQHLTQPLPAPHEHRPPDSAGDPYGQHWQQYGS